MLRKVKINKTNLMVSQICLGSSSFGDTTSEETVFAILDHFYQNGGNFIDTANVYGRWLPEGDNISEKVIGRWLSARKAKDVVVATKCAQFDDPSISRVTEQDIRYDLESSLGALGLERIDFYWLHRDDPSKPIGEIIEIMESLVREGSIRYYGASNYNVKRLEEADRYCAAKGLTGFSGVSNCWNPARLNDSMKGKGDLTLVRFYGDDELEYFKRSHIAFIPYNSTASGLFQKMDQFGLIPDKLRDSYDNAYNVNLFATLKKKASEAGESVQTVLLRHILSYDIQIIPITAVSSVEQLDDIIRV